MAPFNQLFFSLRELNPSRLSAETLQVVRNYGIASVWSSRRGCRSGRRTKRKRATKKYLYCGLANARLLNSCQDALQHHLTISDLDLLLITETWLNEHNGDDILRDICPEGYVAIHRPRHGRRGGGVALIHRCTLRVNPLSINVEVASFEHLSVSIKINSVCINMVTVYRPPSTKPELFLEEFAGCLELLVAIPGRLLVVGDFNIHVDNLVSCKFISLIESFDLLQHVLDPTHIAGHTLDLVLTRREEHLLADCFVADQLSDHSAVHWILKANRPLRPRKSVTLRRLKTVDRGLLLSDLLDLPFVAAPAYETYTVRPDNPWMTEEILTARRNVRRIARRKRSTGLMIDKELLVTALSDLRQLISAAKVTFLNTKQHNN
ncbi:hypothetical protein DAPPUDRAFT_112897 [Daphnia pulex]|uniref:Endonuclease/exonuclease/phosphatase domain-containing protein n=1 Tax=Daphnia pulex TaxID=6669 RepID=E9HDD7_DAPPU|nr:hypothetical protein DAPPUDRAFT_112897 [Daphnia pulex]|eukprot:EFX70233.1 hypothetical protein DAPPUDRAFT_112897 [Daphnia pulex]